ncbi:hypothetical protein AVEN_244252-1 [Araneus ventricosus]|uniref:Uncharacterized protein n=1 Tax=Araneus ventricosus TaxID=182803 RepID=A0A4Y2PN07_ARAVE|nr:hypothetical protein AVEN_244252-1 [Araneus ventricosus]
MNLFNKDYHCCLNTDRRAKGTRPTKHTGCQAKLEIVVKRFIKKIEKPDMMSKPHSCLVKIKNGHNHVVNSVATLKYRDLCPEIRQKFVDSFHLWT